MNETNKKKWVVNNNQSDINQDVYEISKIILENPTRQALETLLEYLKDDDNPNRRNAARKLFLMYIAKTNTYKLLKNEFLNIFGRNVSLFSEIIIESVDEVLQNGFSSYNCTLLLSAVNVLIQMHGKNYLVNVLNRIIPLYKFVLNDFVQQLRANFDETYNFKNDEIINSVNNCLKQILWALAKSPVFNINEYSCDFLKIMYEILSYEKIGLSIKCKCALIFVHCLDRLPPDETKNFIFNSENRALEILTDGQIQGKTFKFQSFPEHNNSAKLALLSALFSCLSMEKQLTVKLKNGDNVFVFIFEELLNCAARPVRDNVEIVEITRILFLMSEKFEKIPEKNFERLFTESLTYLSSYCEYHMDVVAKNANLFMGHLIRASCDHFKKERTKYVENLLEKVNLEKKIDFLTIMYVCTYLGCSFLISKMPFLKDRIWEMLQDQSHHEDASTSYEILMKEHYKEVPFELWLDMWLVPAVGLLKIVDEDKIHIYERIICRAFQINQDILKELFPKMGCCREWGVLLKCLSYARNSKSCPRLSTCDNSIYWWGLIEKNKLKMFAVLRDDKIRVSVLRVITECNRTTEYFTEWEFSFLIDYYILNGSIQVPHVRKQVLTLYKKAVTRFNASLDCIRKQIENSRKKNVDDNSKNSYFVKLRECYAHFLKQFVQLLITNLAPDSNFPRRSFALEMLLTIHAIVERKNWELWWKNHDIENLKLILMDTYEVNKKMALDLLLKFDKKKYKFDDTVYYAGFFGGALNYASDMKPSNCLSAAYMLQLCCNSPNFFELASDENEMTLNIIILLTSEMLSKLKTDIFDDVSGDEVLKSPCYGMLLCLRYLMRQRNDKTEWNNTYASAYKFIFTICQRLFKMLLPIVSNAAPEGYLPDYEDIIKDDTVKAQKVLVFAWRTIKEITWLFADFASQNNDHRVLTVAECTEIGGYFVDLFLQAKHKGVFEQAYVAFVSLCECYWKSQHDEINELPLKWLRAGLDLANKLSPTRRSAGLPFLIMGILTTDPSLDRTAFHQTMGQLITMASNGDDISRTHAINILRFLFRNTKLGDLVASYIEPTSELTLTGLQSNDWGIRNSSTLLFAALMTRLFGVQRTQDSENVTAKNRMTVKVFTSRYPKLLDCLVSTLKRECRNDSQVLHPVLLLFSRLIPNGDGHNEKIIEAIFCIRKCLSSSSFEIRKLAARASVALIFPKDLRSMIERNFIMIGEKTIANNECHGLLLEIWYGLKNKIEHLDLNEIIQSSFHILEKTGTTISHHCVALYMNILSFLFSKFYGEKIDIKILRKILASMSRLSNDRRNLTGRYNFEAAMINLTITIVMVRSENMVRRNIDFENYLIGRRDQLTMKLYSLHFVLYVNISYSVSDVPLFSFEELRVSDLVKNEIDNFTRPVKREFLISIHRSMVDYLFNEFDSAKRHWRSENRECFVLHLLLLSFYPCVLIGMNNGNIQKTVDDLLDLCATISDGEIESAVIDCLTVLLGPQTRRNTRLEYKRLIVLLRHNTAPDVQIYRRMSVCRFLIRCRHLYFHARSMTYDDVVHFLNMVMTLFEDESLLIRNEISSLTDDLSLDQIGWQCSPDKARLDFIKSCHEILPRPVYITFLLSWSMRHFPDNIGPSSECKVFEGSAVNTYAENVPIVQIAGKILRQILWDVPYNLNYEDKSIFIEEQCQLVTTVLLDAFCNFGDKNAFPMVEQKTKVSVFCLFRSILVYLDLKAIDANFKIEFSKFFRERIFSILNKISYKKDYESVLRMFLWIYRPVLLDNFDYD